MIVLLTKLKYNPMMSFSAFFYRIYLYFISIFNCRISTQNTGIGSAPEQIFQNGRCPNLKHFGFRVFVDDFLDEAEQDVQVLLLAGGREDLQVEVLRDEHLQKKLELV